MREDAFYGGSKVSFAVENGYYGADSECVVHGSPSRTGFRRIYRLYRFQFRDSIPGLPVVLYFRKATFESNQLLKVAQLENDLPECRPERSRLRRKCQPYIMKIDEFYQYATLRGSMRSSMMAEYTHSQ